MNTGEKSEDHCLLDEHCAEKDRVLLIVQAERKSGTQVLLFPGNFVSPGEFHHIAQNEG